MQLHFTRIPYAVTLPDGELADENYIGRSTGVRILRCTNGAGNRGR